MEDEKICQNGQQKELLGRVTLWLEEVINGI